MAIAVGVTISKKNQSKLAIQKSNTPTNPDAVNQTDPNDPSSFVKDSNLKQSFYGLAYTPSGSQLPYCGNKLGQYANFIDSFFCSDV